MQRRRRRRFLAVFLACLGATGCFPEFDRDRLTDTFDCGEGCDPGWTCLPDGGCAAPGEDVYAPPGDDAADTSRDDTADDAP
jgi:hypothetical protein